MSRVINRVMRPLRSTLGWAAAFVAGLAGLTMAAPAHAVPSFEAVRAAHRPSDLTLLDRHGVPIQTLRVDPQARRLDWVPLEAMSPALQQAIVLGEDRDFYAHGGVDWSAVAAAAWANLWNTRTRGASTLTMQLAGLLDDELARPAGGRRLGSKIDQALAARRLEASWRKSEILEAYLNLVAWRGEIVGIGALTQTLFGKQPAGLDAQEAAIAAALLRGPNASADTVARRACRLLELQRRSCTGLDARSAVALARPGGMPLGEQLAPHFARQAIDRDGPPRQPSTLDAGLQRQAIAALRGQLAELQGRQVEDGAVLVLDNASGEVRAWVGSSGSYSAAAEVDGVLARRQPGSTLKPFVYGLAFERRLLTAASLLHDAPAEVATAAGLYAPQNYDRGYKGWVSARSALGASLNVPAVRVAGLVGVEALAERLDAFGLALQHGGGHYGLSLALGSAEVRLLDLTNAYRALARGGLWSPAALRPGTPRVPPQRVADEAASFLVGDILADNNARARGFGLDSVLATRGWAAVKTGTSKDLRDNWCIGWTERYTVGVWVGNAGGAPMRGVSGSSGAAPVWQALVRALHEDAPSRPPAMPAGLRPLEAAFDGAVEPTRREFFLAGTAPAGTQTLPPAAPRHGIASPRDGSLFALDPDMPPAAQRIVFEGEAGTWVLNGRRLGRGERWRWAPWPGRHELALVGPDGRVKQTVRFEVRGALVRPH